MHCSAEDGDRIVRAAVQAYKTVHCIVNNAGNLRDKAFMGLKEEDWDSVYKTHLYGTFAVTKAAWPLLRAQKYGRILNISSTTGLVSSYLITKSRSILK